MLDDMRVVLQKICDVSRMLPQEYADAERGFKIANSISDGLARLTAFIGGWIPATRAEHDRRQRPVHRL